jgi:hypothetical protein
MGKKNKGKYDKLGYHGKQEADRKMAKQYGIDVSEYGNQGRPGTNYTNKKSYDDLKQDVARAAANDYDVRRSIEAAQLAGNKKAQKIGSISNASEAYAATRFMEKTHKNRMGNGGAYDGANDQGGVTNYWVNKDRDKLKDSMSVSDQQKEAAASSPKEEPYKPSKEMTDAREKVAAWESGTYDKGIYGSREQSTAPTPQQSSSPYQRSKGESQLDAFKQQLKERKNFQPSL